MTDHSAPSDIAEVLRAAAGDDPSAGSTGDTPSDSAGTNSGTQNPMLNDDIIGGTFKPTSEETITERETRGYLEEIKDIKMDVSSIRDDLLGLFSKAFSRETVLREGDKKANGADHPKLIKPKVLDELTCARVLLARHRICAISLASGRSGDDLTLLGMYEDSGEDEGLYLTSEAPILRLAYELKPSLTANGAESLIKTMKAMAPVVGKTLDAHLIPVANGVFNHETRELEPFSPERVFLTKSPVNYVENPPNPVFTQPDGTPWDVETWIDDLSDDEGVPELLWEIKSATLRPGVNFNKAAFLHSTKGNNGKGTYCELLRGLVGPEGHASIPIAKFGEQFALAELIHARAIVVDENPVGAFAKDLGDFKAVITGDTFTLERKYKNPLSVSFSGMVVQCVNDFPKSRDKSASYTRRQLFVPFRKWFGGDGVERKYIKEDYLKRPEVLEYVLHKALNMDHTELSNPPACQALLAEFQRENNPVRDFWLDHADEFAWDLLPTAFLYECFLGWFKKTHPSGIPVNRNEFTGQLAEVVFESDDWDFSDPQKKHRPGQKMVDPEKLIVDYDLKDWMNPSYSGSDWRQKALFSAQRANYKGVTRIPKPAAAHATAAGDKDDDTATQDSGD